MHSTVLFMVIFPRWVCEHVRNSEQTAQIREEEIACIIYTNGQIAHQSKSPSAPVFAKDWTWAKQHAFTNTSITQSRAAAFKHELSSRETMMHWVVLQSHAGSQKIAQHARVNRIKTGAKFTSRPNMMLSGRASQKAHIIPAANTDAKPTQHHLRTSCHPSRPWFPKCWGRSMEATRVARACGTASWTPCRATSSRGTPRSSEKGTPEAGVRITGAPDRGTLGNSLATWMYLVLCCVVLCCVVLCCVVLCCVVLCCVVLCCVVLCCVVLCCVVLCCVVLCCVVLCCVVQYWPACLYSTGLLLITFIQ